ncbi:hypothetical protein FHL15_000791 [Xylaria flabelliformis]|uniref:Chitin-binding type-1 domain-containing protein n=1 Tax=Xylaria flabelliformis TaxID=2512241 RepID=A0A553ID74_9PEZI|nr:hypothetical protein FHL15_000791 [Xylaria flabelliformis]
MALNSLPLTGYEDPQKGACPDHFGFYRCGNVAACCPADPCGFLEFDNPCDAAIAALENQDSNNGDDGNGDDGDKDTITITTTTTTTRHASTLTPTPFSTKNTKTTSTADGSETSSVLETKNTASFTNLPFASSVDAPTTVVNSSTSATGSSSTSLSSSSSVTETMLPAPSEESNNSNGTAAPLPDTTIAGASVGGVVGGIALLLLVFWLLRRRRLSKRMSSLRGDSPGPNRPPHEKSIMDRHHSLTGTALGVQSFPEIGGQPPNPNQYSTYTYTEQPLLTGPRPDEGWPLRTASDPSLHQQFSSQQQPVYAELDSAETRLPGIIPSVTQSLNRRPSPQIHPSQLTPGFPGTQMAIQSRSGSGNFNVGVDQGYHGYATSGASGNANANANVLREAPPRATLNATDDERLNNLYANSWARGL